MKALIKNATADSTRKNSHTCVLTEPNQMPLVKLDFTMQVIECNETGIEFLNRMGGFLSEKAIWKLVAGNPCLLDESCCDDIVVTIDGDRYYFSAVAFREAGYIGLYGYRMVIHEYFEYEAA